MTEVAVELVDEVGVGGFTADEVLRRVGLTSGVLYHHFGDANGLLEAALVSIYTERLEESRVQFEKLFATATTKEEFRRAMRMLTDTTQRPELAPVRLRRAETLAIAIDSPTMRDQIAEVQDRLTSGIEAVIAGVAAKGWLRPGLDLRAVAVFIQAYTLGRIVDDLAETKVDAPRWNELITHVVESALISED